MNRALIVAALVAVASDAHAADARAADGLDAILARPGGLTEADVAKRAAAASPTVQERDAERVAADETAAATKILRWPRLTAQARYTRLQEQDASTIPDLPIEVSIPGPTPNRYSGDLTLGVPLSDHLLRIPQAIAATQAGAEAARWQVAAAEVDAVATARLAYWDWVELSLTEVALTQGLATAKEHLGLVEVAARAGAAADADVLGVKAQVAAVELRLQRVRSGIALTAERIATLTDAAPPTAIGEALADEPSPQDLLEAGTAGRPEYRALAAGDDALRAQASLARAGQWPRLDAQAHAAIVNPNPRAFPQDDTWDQIWDVSVVATFVLNDLPTARHDARATEARRHALAAKRSALDRGLRLQALAARRALADAGVALATSRDALAAADEALRVRTLAFRNGGATSSELTDAETTLLSARLDHVNARVAARRARVLADQAVGRR